ncbi:MAG TPA: hypothetical protein VKD26_12640, partial [Streptosporangiaceae bacterium]|nr:hypothetical protein [Streptosporangiaceae bacterium]
MTPAPRSSPGSKLRLAIRDRSQPAAWGLVAVAVVAALAGGLFVVKGEAAGKAQADAAAREAARTTCVSPAASQAAGCPQPPAATSAAHVPPGPQHVRVPAAPKHAAAQPS